MAMLEEGAVEVAEGAVEVAEGPRERKTHCP